MKRKTRFKDCNGEPIYIGDVVLVQEYPDEYVGGSLDFEGRVYPDNNGQIVVCYSDIGEWEEFPLSMFSKRGRTLLTEKQQYEYAKTQNLGGEPTEMEWKRDVYRNTEYEPPKWED